MNIRDVTPDYSQSLDLGDMILHECPCGSNMWRIIASFEDYEISTYFTDAECVFCGTRAKVPTPLDRPLGTD
jgi:hypothetical protein